MELVSCIDMEIYGRLKACTNKSTAISLLKHYKTLSRVSIVIGDDIRLSVGVDHIRQLQFDFYFSMEEIVDFVRSVDVINILEVCIEYLPPDAFLKQFSDWIEHTTSIHRMNFIGWRGMEGGRPIIEALKSNASITKLQFWYCPNADILKVCEIIEHNTTITDLIVEDCRIQDVTPVARLLETNKTLKSLNLMHNFIQDIEGLSKALMVNDTLETLLLSGNNILNTKPLEECLVYNTTLEKIGMSNNGKGPFWDYNAIYCPVHNNSIRKKTLFELMMNKLHTLI